MGTGRRPSLIGLARCLPERGRRTVAPSLPTVETGVDLAAHRPLSALRQARI